MLKVKYLKQRKIFEISLTKSRIYKKLQTSGIIREPERGGGGGGGPGFSPGSRLRVLSRKR